MKHWLMLVGLLLFSLCRKSEAEKICRSETLAGLPTLLCGNITNPVSDQQLATELKDLLKRDHFRTIIIDNSASKHTLSFTISEQLFAGFTSVVRLQIRNAKLISPVDSKVLKPLNVMANTLQLLSITYCTEVYFELITSIFDTGDKFPNLRQLNLDYNTGNMRLSLSTLTPAAVILEQLTFSGTILSSISTDCSKGGKWRSLKYLDLSDNVAPDSAPAAFFSKFNISIFECFPNLEWLSLQNNGITTEKFWDILPGLPPSLTDLNVANNRISYFNFTQLERLPKLRNLTISQNSNFLSGTDTSGNVTFPLLPNLENLWLRNTGLSRIPADLLDKMQKLTTLDCRDNTDITIFPNNLVARFWEYGRNPRTQQILLQSTSLGCKCENYNLMHWLASGVGHTPAGDGIFCYPDGRGNTRLCPSCKLKNDVAIGLETAYDNQEVKTMNCPAPPAHSENSCAVFASSFLSLCVTFVVSMAGL
ncbi:hypothetical protein BV898_02801 [Hypsibius exemplaris]|uniref:Uncharacterized protein n=1 Tax=Hypsibius exemplaris TaxID=2072580 RepID=A0A1W0X751_HYPEX|nr:hypothetical protein BV898_02801 [Hypsibius exemplaris]